MPRKPPYTEAMLREAVAQSFSVTTVLRYFGKCHTGGSAGVVKKYIKLWCIDDSHFDPYHHQRGPGGLVRINDPQPLEEILVEHSTYSRHSLKKRLYSAGLKIELCEMCWQGPIWNGRRMSLILDHHNGVRDDNRIANLRIVCPNCNATLDTHCGKNK